MWSSMHNPRGLKGDLVSKLQKAGKLQVIVKVTEKIVAEAVIIVKARLNKGTKGTHRFL